MRSWILTDDSCQRGSTHSYYKYGSAGIQWCSLYIVCYFVESRPMTSSFGLRGRSFLSLWRRFKAINWFYGSLTLVCVWGSASSFPETTTFALTVAAQKNRIDGLHVVSASAFPLQGYTAAWLPAAHSTTHTLSLSLLAIQPNVATSLKLSIWFRGH